MSGWGGQPWGESWGSGAVDAGPQITIVSPTPGIIPGTREQAINTPIVLDVTDITPDLQDVILWASFDGGQTAEVVADGAAFLSRYAAGSGRAAITNGFRYTVFRLGGWPGDIGLYVRAFDALGNTV